MHSGYAAWAARWRVPLGFALGIAYLVFCQPTPMLLAIGGSIAFLGLLLRACAAGYLDKGRSLATGGPYRYSRNPLYLGSSILGCGFAIAGGRWWLVAAFLVFLLLIYWPVMQREAEFLRREFGEAYERYAAAVSVFVSVRPGPRPEGQAFRCEQYRRNREYQAAIGYTAGILFLLLKMALR